MSAGPSKVGCAHARFYDPTTFRFTQPDTIIPDPGNSQSLNRYAYVRNNPMKYNDPTGHEEDEGGDDVLDCEGTDAVKCELDYFITECTEISNSMDVCNQWGSRGDMFASLSLYAHEYGESYDDAMFMLKLIVSVGIGALTAPLAGPAAIGASALAFVGMELIFDEDSGFEDDMRGVAEILGMSNADEANLSLVTDVLDPEGNESNLLVISINGEKQYHWTEYRTEWIWYFLKHEPGYP